MGVKGATLLQILQYQTFMGKSCRTMSKVCGFQIRNKKVSILTKKRSTLLQRQLFFRYGSELMVVDSYTENNMTASMVPTSLSNNHYWLGLATVDDLRTNTLESAAGALVSQYAGFWDLRQPNPKNGECVDVHITSDVQSWELTTCETLLPFMCKATACPSGKQIIHWNKFAN